MNLIEMLRELISRVSLNIIKIESLSNVITSLVMVLFWIILGQVVIRIVKLILLKTSKFEEKHTKQGITIRRLINSLIKAIFLFWITLMILKEIGIDVLPVLAGAGVFAFAVGFGAQELIKDLISGFFLILEKTLSIGDYVIIKDISGTVTDIGLRRIRIENWKGEVITINNGDIRTVLNASINKSVAAIDFNVSFKQDLKVFETESFKNFVKNFASNNEDVLDEGSQVLVTDLLTSKVTLRITFKTNTRKHVGVEREFRKALLNYAKENNIDLDIPLVIENN